MNTYNVCYEYRTPTGYWAQAFGVLIKAQDRQGAVEAVKRRVGESVTILSVSLRPYVPDRSKGLYCNPSENGTDAIDNGD